MYEFEAAMEARDVGEVVLGGTLVARDKSFDQRRNVFGRGGPCRRYRAADDVRESLEGPDGHLRQSGI